MALKYWFEFTDIKEIVHRVEISNTAFTGTSTQIYGSCSLEVSETKDTLEPFRGSGLQIEIEANQFARALLMPELMLRMYYSNLPKKLSFKEKKKRTAKAFGVTCSMVMYRLIECEIIDYGMPHE